MKPTFYRFKLISPATVGIYSLLALLFIALPPPSNPIKFILGLGLLMTVSLKFANHFIRSKFASGIWLTPTGFILQQEPFGFVKTHYSYTGFLRLFALPASRKLVFAFAKEHLKSTPISSLQSTLATSSTNTIVWLTLPPINNTSFIPDFLSHVEKNLPYQESATLLPDIDVLKVYQTHLNSLYLWQNLVNKTRFVMTVLVWILGYQVQQETSDPVFLYSRQSKQAAWGLIGITLGIATIGVQILAWLGAKHELVLSIRLLALIAATGPVAWLIIEQFHRHAGVIFKAKTLVLRQPLRYFDRQIPYEQIAIFTESDGRLVLLRLIPRRVAPGDEPRPPKPRLLMSIPLDEIKQCLVLLGTYTENHQEWTATNLLKRKQWRALRRRLVIFLLMPIIILISTIVMARFIFSILSI